jgi:hypothetical protein
VVPSRVVPQPLSRPRGEVKSHAFRDLTSPLGCDSLLARLVTGPHRPNRTTHATASRPTQQACHQPAGGAGRSLIRLAGSGAELPEILKQEPNTARRPTYGHEPGGRQRTRGTPHTTHAHRNGAAAPATAPQARRPKHKASLGRNQPATRAKHPTPHCTSPEGSWDPTE